jgi:hypothetical protein
VTLTGIGRRRAGTRLRAAGLVGAALLSLTAISGCGTGFSPGSAATINGTTISQDQVDSIVSGACAFTAASSDGSTGTTPTSLASLRATVTQALIQFNVTDAVTKAMKLSVSQAAITQAIPNQVPSGLGKADTAALKSFFYDYAKSSSQAQLIGAHLVDSSITTSEQVEKNESSVASTYLGKYAAKQDITVNPAYGRWNGASVVGGSSSLSDAVSSSAKDSLAAATSSKGDTTGLLSTQVC